MFELRNALLAAYLDGEAASVAILNDYLMEQGEEPGRLHGNDGRRLRVVLGLISPDLSHRIACDYAEHVADLFEAAYPDDGRVREVIEVKCRWLTGDATGEQLKAARKGVLQAIDDIQRGRLTPRTLRTRYWPDWQYRNAAEQAARSAFYASTHSAHTARDCCAAAVRAAREAPSDFGRSESKEITWQVARLRRSLLHAEAEAG